MATTSISLASVALAPSIGVADRPIPGLLIGGRAVSGGAEWPAPAMGGRIRGALGMLHWSAG